MLLAILLILIVLWFLGYGPLDALNFPLFQLRGHIIDLWDALIFLVAVWLIGTLPGPLRQIAGVVLLLWLLSVFGVFAIAGLSNILIIALIIGLVLYIISGH